MAPCTGDRMWASGHRSGELLGQRLVWESSTPRTGNHPVSWCYPTRGEVTRWGNLRRVSLACLSSSPLEAQNTLVSWLITTPKIGPLLSYHKADVSSSADGIIISGWLRLLWTIVARPGPNLLIDALWPSTSPAWPCTHGIGSDPLSGACWARKRCCYRAFPWMPSHTARPWTRFLNQPCTCSQEMLWTSITCLWAFLLHSAYLTMPHGPKCPMSPVSSCDDPDKSWMVLCILWWAKQVLRLLET